MVWEWMEDKIIWKTIEKLKKLGLEICRKIGIKSVFMGSLLCQEMHNMGSNWFLVKFCVENSLNWAPKVHFWRHVAPITGKTLSKNAKK